ncbi:hypothetical protein GCM10023238_29170 [Streptomyces heliomycini]
MSPCVIALPSPSVPSVRTHTDGPTAGAWGYGAWPCSRTMPMCQSCGTIVPPAACTASATFAQPASCSSPWNRGTRSLCPADSCPTYVPSVTISPTPAAARRE